MVKQMDLEKRREEIITKIDILKKKKVRAEIEYKLKIEKLDEKIESANKELSKLEVNKIDKITCCGFSFTSKESYEKHLKTQLHRRNTEPYIICPVSGKLFFGCNRSTYNDMPLKEKRKYEWYKHYHSVCFCQICLEEFKSAEEQKNHVCEIEDSTEDTTTYNTLDEMIEMDDDFDFDRLADLEPKHKKQVKEFFEIYTKNKEDCIYFIEQNNLYYKIKEVNADSDGYDDICSFRIPTLAEDYTKALNIEHLYVVDL